MQVLQRYEKFALTFFGLCGVTNFMKSQPQGDSVKLHKITVWKLCDLGDSPVYQTIEGLQLFLKQ